MVPRISSATNCAYARPYSGNSQFSTNNAGISSTILRTTANMNDFIPIPHDWNTPSARKSMHKNGSAKQKPRRNAAPYATMLSFFMNIEMIGSAATTNVSITARIKPSEIFAVNVNVFFMRLILPLA